MPLYRVITRIYNEWVCNFEAPNETVAKEMAYDESQPDVGPNDYIVITAIELTLPDTTTAQNKE